MITISIVNDFDEYPGLRNCSISEASGEEFYHKILNKKFVEAYNTNDKLEVILDGTGGFASSFLDEAFGNLVYDFTLPVVKQRLIIISNEKPHWKDMIESQTMPQWEERRKRNENVKTTAKHDVWGRLLNGKIELKRWSTPV